MFLGSGVVIDANISVVVDYKILGKSHALCSTHQTMFTIFGGIEAAEAC